MSQVLRLWGEAAWTSTAFFWKAGWAFVMGYAISAMIQAFVPKVRLTRHMGDAGWKSIGLATGFGAASSSCSFAALSAARALLQKGAHWVASIAFMFASTNLVIELGVLIYIFLGWRYVLAEIVGGLVLIAISTTLVRRLYPRRWLEEARAKVEEEAQEEEDDFDPWARMRSAEGWRLVGMHFVMEWQMVWREILVGFTVAGLMKTVVPNSVWRTLFLARWEDRAPDLLLALENALVAPLVACLTFIGSMGNIPLASVLAGGGVAFAGILGFIYSDLMVPPLVRVNARYYGWRVALWIAGIMYASIVATAVLLHAAFAWAGLTPEAGASSGVQQQPFAVDYTFWLNLAFAAVALVLVRLWSLHRRGMEAGMEHQPGGTGAIQRAATWLAAGLVAGGLVLHLLLD